MWRQRLGYLCAGVLWLSAVSSLPGETPGEIQFNRDVRPIVTDYCFQCHGPDAARREAGLRLDQRAAATAELDSGEYAIVPGDAAASELVRRITNDDPDLRMPPAELQKNLSAEQIAVLTQWINEGAEYEPHWAFVPPVRRSVPIAHDQVPQPPPIEALVRRRLEVLGWEPAPEASRETLIRRLSFDLRGLPPTLEEIDQFLADTAEGAYDRLVDRLLNSPHYGERMATMWLDGARFADTNGYQNDFNRSMWPYRDVVIQAFNANQPFDQFTVEQIAGDLLPGAARTQQIASGFNRNHRTVTEGGSLEEEWLVENVVDRVETTATVFLGLTMGCARCHDHKFDPISQREFYEFFDFFHHVDEQGVYTETRGNVAPLVHLMTRAQEAQHDMLVANIERLKAECESLRGEVDATYENWLRSPHELPPPPAPPVAALTIPLDGSRRAMPSGEGAGAIELTSAQPPSAERSELGTALLFDGKHWLDCGESYAPERDEPFSLSMWVRPEGSGAIVAKMEATQRVRGFDLLPFGEGRLSVHLIHAWPANALKVVTRQAMDTASMNHLVVTYDGSSSAAGVKIYFNGEQADLDVEYDALTDTIATKVPLQVGRRAGGNFFTGAVQDLRCYTRELGIREIRELQVEKLADLVRASQAENQKLAAMLRAAFIGLAVEPACGQCSQLLSEQQDSTRMLQRLLSGLPTTMVMKERAMPRETFVLTRGQYNLPDKRQRVTAGTPACLPPLPPDAPANRLGLARWLVDRRNPLTARVFVNRVWEHFFGVGLVATSENFGYRGELPSHPELLDYLAVEFASDWDVKALIRRIVTSATYRQTSAVSGEQYLRDPQNRWLARGPRFRLPAEFVRDNALSISGLLSAKIGGPSVKPYQPEGLWEELAGGANGGPYVQAGGEDLYRRSLYTFRKRTVPHPTLATFDAPSWEVCQVRRAVTNTPLQALALMNDLTYLECARKLAERMLTEGGDHDNDRVQFGFRLCTSRFPGASEQDRLMQGLRRFAEYFYDAELAREYVNHGAAPKNQALDVRQLAAFTALASSLLNLDETITKE